MSFSLSLPRLVGYAYRFHDCHAWLKMYKGAYYSQVRAIDINTCTVVDKVSLLNDFCKSQQRKTIAKENIVCMNVTSAKGCNEEICVIYFSEII